MSQAHHVHFKIVPEKDDAFRRACDMEDPLVGIENFARALGRVAQTLADGDGVIVLHLAQSIRTLVQELEKPHEYFFRLHHPDRERFEREGWPTDTGEIAAEGR
jgi:hypothetical protein